jgi:hypothetical protein
MANALSFEGCPVSGPTTGRPVAPPQGQFYFDEDFGQWFVWDDSQGTSGGWRLASGVVAEEILFTETAAAGVYTGAVAMPAGSTLVDVIVNGVALWAAASSATLIVGDGTDPDGFFTGVNLKATDLLAGESLSLALAGGKAGAYIANSQVSPRYAAAARSVIAEVTTVGSTGATGRTRVVVVYTLPRVKNAAKVAS